jgi:hypothetical protein
MKLPATSIVILLKKNLPGLDSLLKGQVPITARTLAATTSRFRAVTTTCSACKLTRAVSEVHLTATFPPAMSSKFWASAPMSVPWTTVGVAGRSVANPEHQIDLPPEGTQDGIRRTGFNSAIFCTTCGVSECIRSADY